MDITASHALGYRNPVTLSIYQNYIFNRLKPQESFTFAKVLLDIPVWRDM